MRITEALCPLRCRRRKCPPRRLNLRGGSCTASELRSAHSTRLAVFPTSSAGIDHFDAFQEKMCTPDAATGEVHRYRKALLFCDNAGADLILGMVPLARELLIRGTDVVMVANSLPAINDITVIELHAVLAEVAKVDPIVRAAVEAAQDRAPPSPFAKPRLQARAAARAHARAMHGHVPKPACAPLRPLC